MKWRFCSTALMFSLVGGMAQAAVQVTISGNELEPKVRVDADSKELTVFQNGQDLWLVAQDDDDIVLYGTDRKTGLTDREKLNVNGGQGVRLRFEQSIPKVSFNKTSKDSSYLSLMALQDGVYLPSGKGKMLTAQSSKLNEIYAVIPRGGIAGQKEQEIFSNIQLWPTSVGYVLTDVNGNIPAADVQSNMLVLKQDAEDVSAPSVAAILPPVDPSRTATAKEALTQVHSAIERITGMAVPKRYVPKRERAEDAFVPEEVPVFDQQYPTALEAPEKKKDFLAAEEPIEEEDFDLEFDFDEEDSKTTALSYAEVLIPYYGDDPYEYHKFHRRFTRRFLDAESYKLRNEGRLRLAKLAIAFGRAHEAITMLGNMPKDKATGYPRSDHARLVYGAALVMVERGEEAMKMLESVGETPLVADQKIWLAAAYEQMDRDKESIKLFRKNIDVTLPYPLHLQEALRLSYGRVLLRQQRLSVLVSSMKELTELMPDKQLPAEGLLLLGRANMILNQDELAEELLATAAASDNPEVAFLAQYEFVNFLLKRGDISLTQAIGHLEDLRYLWRGGDMEEEILRKLGRIYLARGSMREGLERLKYYTTYFYDAPKAQDVAGYMTEAFNNLFVGDLQSDMDELAMLGVYYDFRELTPPGGAGDELIRNIGERLHGLGLFERAISLLERQLKYRTKEPEQRAKLGHDLAVLYYLDRQYSDALNALVRTEFDGLSKETMTARTIIQAKVLTAEKRYEEARQVLAQMENDDADVIRSDIGWDQESYDDVIGNLEETFSGENAIRFWTPEDEVDFLRLAISYHQKKDVEKLEELKKTYPERMLKEELRTAVDILLEDMKSEDALVPEKAENELQKVVQALAGYNDFVDYYKEYNRVRDEEKRQRLIFNRRMRQISAPTRR